MTSSIATSTFTRIFQWVVFCHFCGNLFLLFCYISDAIRTRTHHFRWKKHFLGGHIPSA